ncbi:unnamed protein product, partial [Owenia fusiformis]
LKMADEFKKFVLTIIIISLQYQETPGHYNTGLSVVPYDNGQYEIHVNNITWLRNAPTFCTINGAKYEDGSNLKLVSFHKDTGSFDKLGPYQDYIYTYNAGGVTVSATIRDFWLNSTVVFIQEYPEGARGTSTGKEHGVIFGFPNFKVEELGLNRGYVSYGGIFIGDIQKQFGRWKDDTTFIKYGLDGGPLSIIDKQNNVLFISPFDNFMAANNYHDKLFGGAVSWGIMGKVNTIPKGFKYSTILHYGSQGYNKAVESWGKVMRQWNGKWNLNAMKNDITINYLGYWTDNGAYYYYNTVPNRTYEETILDAKAYGDKLGIPYRYLQYDSWWYPKGTLNGAISWDAMPQIFPNGLEYIYNKTKLPVIAHNRWWSSKVKYAKDNGGKYNFIIEKFKSMPDDEQFWIDLLAHSKTWGLVTYEQDWLNVEFSGMERAISDLDLGSRWLTQMARGAAANNMTIQYCMAQVRDGLQSLTLPAVTQVRVSEDYSPGWEQWRIGFSSILAYALGLAPYKDTFWSTTKQPGNPYGKTEPYPALNAVVSTLSTGPVGVGDMIGGTNKTLVMMSCNAEGLLLKPSKPATAIDAQIIESAYQDGEGPAGEVWFTYTSIGPDPEVTDIWRFGILLAASMTNNYDVPLSQMDLLTPQKYRVYYLSGPPSKENIHILPDYLNDAPIKLTPSCTEMSFCLYYVTPAIYMMSVHQEVLILGELDKWVHMSAQRVISILQMNVTIYVKIKGVAGEKFSYYKNKEVIILGEITKWTHISSQRLISLDGGNISLTLTIKGVYGETLRFWYAINQQLDYLNVTIPEKGQTLVQIFVYPG